MKAKGKVKKQKYSKGERDVDNIFQKKGESVQDALKRIITREHQRIVEKEKQDLTAAPAKIAPIETEEEAKYKGSQGDPVRHNGETLEDICTRILERFDLLFKLTDGAKETLVNTKSCVDGCVYIGKSLVQDAYREIEETARFIEEKFGRIEIDYAMYNQHVPGIRDGQRLGITFESAGKAEK
jgi:hypothetical protein